MPLPECTSNDEGSNKSAPLVQQTFEVEPLRTPEQVRAFFETNGISMADWARARGFSVRLTRLVAAGKRRCLRGQSHQIAVELGMKRGVNPDCT